MLSFNFNKKKETGVKQVHVGDKLLYEGMFSETYVKENTHRQ